MLTLERNTKGRTTAYHRDTKLKSASLKPLSLQSLLSPHVERFIYNILFQNDVAKECSPMPHTLREVDTYTIILKYFELVYINIIANHTVALERKYNSPSGMFLWRKEWVGVVGGATLSLAFADTDAQVIH